ncbi:hypothetical protein DL767_001283 [Monosporascus sp. MG133]|nr:hypothetical protein DL767_001283 [Monosporascus sp. MG133]
MQTMPNPNADPPPAPPPLLLHAAAASNGSSWEAQLRKTYAVLLTWGYGDGDGGDADGRRVCNGYPWLPTHASTTVGGVDGRPATSLVCVSATDYDDGVRMPDDVPQEKEEEEGENAAPALLTSAGGAGALALVVAPAAGVVVAL